MTHQTHHLSIRRRRASAPAEAPPIQAFLERAPEQVAIPVARTEGSNVAVVFQPPRHLHDPNPKPLDLEAFHIGNEGPQLAAVALKQAGKVAVVTAMVPLTLLYPALATAAPPSLPEGKTPETMPAQPDGTEKAEPDDGIQGDSAETPARAPDSTASSESRDSLWEALVGEDLILVKSDDSRVSGRLLGVQSGRLVLARRSDGLVIDVDPASISGIYSQDDEVGPQPEPPGQAAIDPELARKPGTGLMIGGGVLLGLSGTFFVSAALVGLGGLGYYNSYYGSSPAPEMYVPLIVAGVLAAGGGVPMVVIGAIRHKKLKQATTERRLRASVSPNLNGGWSTSLSLRF